MPTSYNGYAASPRPADFGGLAKILVAGESFAPGVRAGDVAVVLEYVAEQLHARVEPVVRADFHQADDWGYSYRRNRNANNLSCHASGTAIDYNATRHPNGWRGTFTADQVAEIRRILTEVDGTVRWGGDFTGTPDEMHFEIVKPLPDVAQVAARIRANGGPERRLGAAPTPAPAPARAQSRPAGRPVLRRGATGPAVRELQTQLARRYPAYRHAHGALAVDGDFGPRTEAWVRELQRRSGLTADGIAGPKTYAVLGLT